MTVPPMCGVLQALAGGLMIGTAASAMLLGLGRVAGISGLAARSAGLCAGGAPRGLATAFILGLPLGALVVSMLGGAAEPRFPSSLPLLTAAGLLVGFGTRLGSGCTSGHGVCGVSRLSRRSLAATGVFMGVGVLTVALTSRWGLAW